MTGITAYGAYVPLRRLGAVTKGWTSPAEKSVAFWDEDSVTMAVAAGINCLNGLDHSAIDGIYFGSTTSPYKEKLAATIAAWALDLRPEILTMDIGDTLRAGTIALRMAADTVKAGSAQEILVTASDLRMGSPRGGQDNGFGDGAAALLIGDKDVAASLEASYTISNELLDVWKADRAKYVRSWEDRFVYEEGYQKILPLAVANFFKKTGLTTRDITKAVFNAPDARRHREMGAALGFQPAQIQNPFFEKMGDTGSAFSLMLLVAALEDAAPGDKILVAGYGDGADVLLFKVTEKIGQLKNRIGMKMNLASKVLLPSYDDYMAYRTFAASDPESPGGASASVVHRERDVIYRLHGEKCKVCGTLQYPPQRVCTSCRTKDQFTPVRFSDKKGKVFTYTLKNGGDIPAFARPMVDSMIDFEGGGRAIFGMTDMDVKDVKVGMDVEMTFRTLGVGGGIHNYAWRCMPPREIRATAGGKEAK